MSISMYQASVFPIIRTLNNLKAVLKKAGVYAEAKKIAPSVLINSRLYPDMLPLSRQVQIASDIAKRGVCRLAGVEPPKHEDNESTFPELMAWLDMTIALLEAFKPTKLMVLKIKPSTCLRTKKRSSLKGCRFCSITCCQMSISMSLLPMPSCGITGWRSANKIF